MLMFGTAIRPSRDGLMVRPGGGVSAPSGRSQHGPPCSPDGPWWEAPSSRERPPPGVDANNGVPKTPLRCAKAPTPAKYGVGADTKPVRPRRDARMRGCTADPARQSREGLWG
jgi:hypothetical protein